jgi:hypothetical protein
VMSADVGVTALPDGSPCSIAVKFDGPSHFMTDNSSSISTSTSNRAAPVDRLDGPTRLRNAFLQARFPDGVVCIPWQEWAAALKAHQQEEYARATLAAVLGTKVRVMFLLGCNRVDGGSHCRAPSCPHQDEHFNRLPQAIAHTVMTSVSGAQPMAALLAGCYRCRPLMTKLWATRAAGLKAPGEGHLW